MGQLNGRRHSKGKLGPPGCANGASPRARCKQDKRYKVQRGCERVRPARIVVFGFAPPCARPVQRLHRRTPNVVCVFLLLPCHSHDSVPAWAGPTMSGGILWFRLATTEKATQDKHERHMRDNERQREGMERDTPPGNTQARQKEKQPKQTSEPSSCGRQA